MPDKTIIELYNDQFGFSLDFPASIPDMRISRESQRNIFSTVKESINNCVKHAGATHIDISLKLEQNKFAIHVHDNGSGFEMDKLKGSGNGLRRSTRAPSVPALTAIPTRTAAGRRRCGDSRPLARPSRGCR